MIIKKIKFFKEQFNIRKKYCTGSRLPFYDLAEKYLPADKNSIIVDIGCGLAQFADYLGLRKKYNKLFLLDSSLETIKNTKGVKYYKAPERLPFDDKSVNFIHSSHLIEHLNSEKLYKFLEEINRVLKGNGLLVISAPLLWNRFYDDLSHIRPYNPKVLLNYLCKSKDNASAAQIATNFKKEKLVYRYRSMPIGGDFYSKYFIIDAILKFFKIALSKCGFRKYIRNGYTIVLKKTI